MNPLWLVPLFIILLFLAQPLARRIFERQQLEKMKKNLADKWPAIFCKLVVVQTEKLVEAIKAGEDDRKGLASLALFLRDLLQCFPGKETEIRALVNKLEVLYSDFLNREPGVEDSADQFLAEVNLLTAEEINKLSAEDVTFVHRLINYGFKDIRHAATARRLEAERKKYIKSLQHLFRSIARLMQSYIVLEQLQAKIPEYDLARTKAIIQEKIEYLESMKHLDLPVDYYQSLIHKACEAIEKFGLHTKEDTARLKECASIFRKESVELDPAYQAWKKFISFLKV